MKKLIYSVILIVSFVIYGIFQNKLNPRSTNFASTNSQPTTNTIPSLDTNSTDVATNTNTTNTPSPKTPTQSPPPQTTPPVATGKFKNGSYTGSVADAYYGNLQVKAIISGGKLANIEFLQYPNDRQHSIEINTYALPILRQEAISAQSASVDAVSGASDSSQAFVESLASALNQAKI